MLFIHCTELCVVQSNGNGTRKSIHLRRSTFLLISHVCLICKCANICLSDQSMVVFQKACGDHRCAICMDELASHRCLMTVPYVLDDACLSFYGEVWCDFHSKKQSGIRSMCVYIQYVIIYINPAKYSRTCDYLPIVKDRILFAMHIFSIYSR